MDKEQLGKLRQLWATPLWDEYVKYLEKEAQGAITACRSKTDERALGRYFFIKQLLSMRDTAVELFNGAK